MTTMQGLRALVSESDRQQLDRDLELFGICFAEKVTSKEGVETAKRVDPRLCHWHHSEQRYYLQTRAGLIPMPGRFAMEGGVR